MDTALATDINLANINAGYGVLASATPAPITIPQCHKDCIIITSDDSGTQGERIVQGVKMFRFIDPSVQNNAVQNVLSKIRQNQYLEVTHGHNKHHEDKSNTVGIVVDAFINVSGYYNTDGSFNVGTGEPCYVVKFNDNISQQQKEVLQKLHLSTEFRNTIRQKTVAENNINSIIPKGCVYDEIIYYEISRLALVESPRSGHALDTPITVCNSDDLDEHNETEDNFFNNQMNIPESVQNAGVKNDATDIEAVAEDIKNNDELEKNSDSLSSDAVLDVLQSIDSTLKALLAVMPAQGSVSQNSEIDEAEANEDTPEEKTDKPNNDRLESESTVQNNIFDDPDEGKGCKKTSKNEDPEEDDSVAHNSGISEADELRLKLSKMFAPKTQQPKKPITFHKLNN